MRIAETDDGLRLEVADDGTGMTARAIAVLVDTGGSVTPFGCGHGLGLWMTDRLIRDLGGWSRSRARPSGGAS